MQYVVRVVGDNELPEGMDHALVEMQAGPPLLLINGAPAHCWAFMQANQDLREPCTVPTMLFPSRGHLVAV